MQLVNFVRVAMSVDSVLQRKLKFLGYPKSHSFSAQGKAVSYLISFSPIGCIRTFSVVGRQNYTLSSN